MEQLPKLPMAARIKSIQAHLGHCSRTGATLPSNLSEYLDTEFKKAQSPAVRKK